MEGGWEGRHAIAPFWGRSFRSTGPSLSLALEERGVTGCGCGLEVMVDPAGTRAMGRDTRVGVKASDGGSHAMVVVNSGSSHTGVKVSGKSNRVMVMVGAIGTVVL